MKFENPIMNISMFEVENVVTASAPAEQALTGSAKATKALKDAGYTTVVNVLFD